jgi:hypothetical protein
VNNETVPRDSLDHRVTDEDGQPVAERKLTRGWFLIIRADSQEGVKLVTRIPGYLHETSPHPTQNAAERAARSTYDQYRADVRALAEKV